MVCRRGEYVGSSADATGAGYLAYGILKSTDNGITWTRLPLNNITDFNGNPLNAGVPERFDHPFDYVHKINVNPANGDVYVAGHRRVIRSQNGGTTFQVIFGSAVAGFAAGGQCDVIISATGKVYIAFTGAAADLTLRGVWRSTTGDYNSYTRLAGGQTLGVDSVDGWRVNSYTSTDVGGSPFIVQEELCWLWLLPMKTFCMWFMRMVLPIQARVEIKKLIFLNWI